MTEVKILMVGPQNSGKTALANYIADAVQNAENPSQAPTKPTVGARILEFDGQTKKGNQMVAPAVPCVSRALRASVSQQPVLLAW